MNIETDATGAPSASMSALIVDDDSFSQDLFSEMLSAMGITDIHSALNGRIGLRTLAELPRPPDFLICDVFMPDMDGIEFLTELAKKNYQGGVILISGVDISMLGIAQQLATDNGLKLWGAHSKPVSAATLSETLRAACIAE